MQLATGLIEVRERVLDVVRDAAQLACACEPDRPCIACRARAVLEFLTSSGFRLRRWRNPGGPPISVVHIAGPVIDCREYRRSCPGFIVDRRQTCYACGAELVRGRWAVFFDPGVRVAVLTSRTGSPLGSIPYTAGGAPGEIPCSGQMISRRAQRPVEPLKAASGL